MVVNLRIEDQNRNLPTGFQGESGRVRFSVPGAGEVGEFLDYLEDMSLLIGCANCRSFNVTELMVSGMKVQVCSDCGHSEQIPPAN